LNSRIISLNSSHQSVYVPLKLTTEIRLNPKYFLFLKWLFLLYLLLALIAIIIASPIAWWTMNQWLEDFSYRIDIQWWIFAVAGSAVVMIALLTVSWQATRAALANPVDSLRDE